MAWFRLEGRGAFHHKVLAAGNEAYGAWCRAGQWCSDQLTDGFVPRSVVDQIAKPKVWAKLIDAGLMHEADGGYQIHDFLDWNPPSDAERARRDAMREKRREAGKVGGKRSGEVRRGEANGKQGGSKNEAKCFDDASRPDEANAKQNEPPSPNPSPREKEEDLPPAAAGGASAPSAAPPVVVFSPTPGAAPQMSLLGEPEPPSGKPKKGKAREPTPPAPSTEVKAVWQATWAEAGMSGPAPWGADAAAVAKRYLEEPGASLETARQAIVGMLRTQAGEWHRTHENGKHLGIPAALAGKNVVAFTNAGKAWLVAKEAAARPKREPPPPRPIPERYVKLYEQDMADRAAAASVEPGGALPEAS